MRVPKASWQDTVLQLQAWRSEKGFVAFSPFRHFNGDNQAHSQKSSDFPRPGELFKIVTISASCLLSDLRLYQSIIAILTVI